MPNGRRYRFEEGEQPEGAVLAKAETPKNKARKASNKKRTVAKK